ncbi:hypothetical protein GGI15_003359 [Coemansia interrupta]|uniref:C2H2-type domain-containing protein n=1 Tax=Coemansia interrupta TaxID=1126814 RepID=A0A9W8LJ15_9FUNG|nr:hypothetical protein GGI15_003359 [Coemansia interrupta]
MAFEDEESIRNAGEATTPATGGGWGADVDTTIGSPRDKFRRAGDSPDRRDRFGRDYRSRSPDDRGIRRRSRSPPRRSGADDGDRYIPHYDRERESSNDRYSSGGGNSGGRFGNRGYNSNRGNYRHAGRGGDGDGYSRNGGDMMGGRNGGIPDPRSYEQVVPFKYFAEWLKTQDGGRRLEQDEIRERYEDYRRETLQRLYTQFYNSHKQDDWFSERFDPDRRKEYMEKLKELKAENLRAFVADLEAGKFDNLTQTATTEQVMQHEVNRRDQSSANRLGGDDEDDMSAENHTLFIRTVPPSVPRAVLEAELVNQPGFKYLALSEPRQDKQYHRFGWARFENGTDMEKTMDNLSNVVVDQFQFHFSRHNNAASGLRLAPDVASTDDRMRHDLKLVRDAVRSLDERTDAEAFHMLETLQKHARELSAAAGEGSVGDDDDSMAVDSASKAEDGEGDGEVEPEVKGDIAAARRELDLLLEYLRRVHLYCYYCGHTADTQEDFLRRCARHHLRRGLPLNRGPQPSGNWTRNLDNRNDVIIHPLEAERLYKEGGKSLERETDKELDKHIKQLDEGRYRCLLCTKLFKGDAFVRKHIRNKHPEAVPETLVREISFFNNFVREAPHYVQLGTGGALPALGMGAMMGGQGMRGDRGGGYMPQMMPGMMIPGMMATPYMMPGMVPGMMPGMMQMGGPFMNPGMMGMMGGDRGQGVYSQGYRGRQSNGRGSGQGRAGPGGDPRGVRSYVDLDAPPEGEADFGF